MSDFDLTSLIREVHDTTDLTDHRQVAKEVRSRIADADVEVAFLAALWTRVRIDFSLFRGSPTLGTSKPGVRSWRVEGVRKWWKQDLHNRFGTADGQKLLREFSREDCLYQAALDREKATRLIAKAEEWEHLADRLPPGGVVGDLA